MAVDFVIIGSLVRSVGLVFGSCPSGRDFAPRFLQTLLMLFRRRHTEDGLGTATFK
jgi:hypothetical protein